MDKILELLGLEKLDESAQTEIQEKLRDIIEVKAKELSEAKLQEQKDQLIEEYEERFEEYKDDITSKFSNFVDSVLDEEMVIPEKIVEYARKGELYSDIIEQFKARLSIDEGVLDEEVKSLLKEAKEEIIKLREELDEVTASNLELQSDAQEMAAALYLRKKCDGLTEFQKERVLSILEGITDKEEIDRKFNVILEAAKDEEENEETEDEDEETENEEDEEIEESKKGKGHVQVKTKLNEGPFDSYMKEYLNVLKEGI